jgi:hypothetical protein
MGTHRSVSQRAGDVVGNSFFSGSIQICQRLREMLLYVDHVRYVWSRAIHEPSMESMWRVGRVFPAGCISIQIVTTLGYEYRLFVAVIM